MRNRERDGLPGNKFSPTQKQIADEIADVVTYLDLLAHVLGVDLGRAAVAKFNEVSERVGFPDRIALASRPQPARGEVSEKTMAIALALAHIANGIPNAKEVAADALSQAAALEAAARVRESRLAGSNAGCADNCTECQKCEHCGGSGFIDVLDEDGEAFVDVCDGPAHDHESHVGFDAGLEVGGTAHRKVSQNDD
jgi:hypothetical protein